MSDSIEGAAKEGLGRAQNAVGAIVGDVALQAKGKLNETVGGVQRRYGETKDQLRDEVEEFLREQPLLVLAAGVGLGLVLASVLFGRKTVYVTEKPHRQ